MSDRDGLYSQTEGEEVHVSDFASHDVGDICGAIAKRHAENYRAVENGEDVEDIDNE